MDMLAALLCGTLAYTGSLLFGISAARIGVALSFSLLVGTMIAVGVMAPRLMLHQSLSGSAGDDFVLAGVCLSLVSVVFGFISSRGKNAGDEHSPRRHPMPSWLWFYSEARSQTAVTAPISSASTQPI
jgi:hypothetical protein